MVIVYINGGYNGFYNLEEALSWAVNGIKIRYVNTGDIPGSFAYVYDELTSHRFFFYLDDDLKIIKKQIS